MLSVNRKLKLVEYPECFGERDGEKLRKCNKDCEYIKECIEKTVIS